MNACWGVHPRPSPAASAHPHLFLSPSAPLPPDPSTFPQPRSTLQPHHSFPGLSVAGPPCLPVRRRLQLSGRSALPQAWGLSEIGDPGRGRLVCPTLRQQRVTNAAQLQSSRAGGGVAARWRRRRQACQCGAGSKLSRAYCDLPTPNKTQLTSCKAAGATRTGVAQQMRAVVQRVTSASVEASQGGRTCSLQRCEQPHCLGAVAVAAAAAALGNIAVCLTRLPAGGWRDCGQDRAGAAVPGGAEGHGHRKGC